MHQRGGYYIKCLIIPLPFADCLLANPAHRLAQGMVGSCIATCGALQVHACTKSSLYVLQHYLSLMF